MQFHKYGKVYRLGHEQNQGILEDEVIIQEKIDGGNFRFYFTKKGDLVFGSRTQQLTSNKGDDSNVNKQFKKVVDFVRKRASYQKGFEKYIFYGEACFKHTINYDWSKMPFFLGFDVFDTEKNIFVNDIEMTELFNTLNLDVVPLVRYGYFSSNDFTDDLVPKSAYALDSSEDNKAEGIVVKNYKKQLFAKYVRDAFKERNASVFGGTPKLNKVDETNNADFIFKYCSNARIEKIIMRELDDGKKLDMTLMGCIIKKTYLDIIDEEWKEILTSNWILDFKNIRKLIAPRCRAVLENMIVNNAR